MITISKKYLVVLLVFVLVIIFFLSTSFIQLNKEKRALYNTIIINEMNSRDAILNNVIEFLKISKEEGIDNDDERIYQIFLRNRSDFGPKYLWDKEVLYKNDNPYFISQFDSHFFVILNRLSKKINDMSQSQIEEVYNELQELHLQILSSVNWEVGGKDIIKLDFSHDDNQKIIQKLIYIRGLLEDW